VFEITSCYAHNCHATTRIGGGECICMHAQERPPGTQVSRVHMCTHMHGPCLRLRLCARPFGYPDNICIAGTPTDVFWSGPWMMALVVPLGWHSMHAACEPSVTGAIPSHPIQFVWQGRTGWEKKGGGTRQTDRRQASQPGSGAVKSNPPTRVSGRGTGGNMTTTSRER
jgi:hypothetical protein